MGKKKKEEDIVKMSKGLEVLGIVPETEYWKWRLTIEEMKHSETKTQVSARDCRIKELELYNQRQRHAQVLGMVPKSKEEYERVKKEIEEVVGFSIKDCVIDPHCFEVRKLPPESLDNMEEK